MRKRALLILACTASLIIVVFSAVAFTNQPPRGGTTPVGGAYPVPGGLFSVGR
jgi:hypothetical protein